MAQLAVYDVCLGACSKCGHDLSLRKAGKKADGSPKMKKVCLPCESLRIAEIHKADGYKHVSAWKARHPGYSNKYRAAQKARWKDKYPEKARAHDLVKKALKSGKLIKKPCAVCGTLDDVQAHHHDYFAPLDVTWLCRAHHQHEHEKQKAA